MQEQLRQRVMKCKEEVGISFRGMCNACSIPVETFYNFTSGYRNLPERYIGVLDIYLQKFGF